VSHLAGDAASISEPQGPWLTLSAALTECVADIAEREDLMVKCAPGAGDGAPGCFFPRLATVELDGNHLGVDPSTCDPSRPSDRERYAALWGVLVHEAAHARHTAWELPSGALSAAVSAALMLDESRIEAAQLARRPGDRRWLRAATRTLILADVKEAGMTMWDAGHAAALLLARVDAGVLDEDEPRALARTVEDVLGRDRLGELRRIWRAAQSTSDDAGQAMLALGRDWCRVLGIEPEQDAPGPGGEGCASSESSSPLTEAINAALTAVAIADAAVPSSDPRKAAARTAERADRERAATIAERVFKSHEVGPSRSGSPIREARPPTAAEQAAARRLSRALRAAAHRDRVATASMSAAPPGRLRMREVLVAEAQRAAGAIPSAEPFTRTVRRSVPSPPLRLGIACDVSGSMAALAKPVASAAWILARAAAHVPDARSATVVFGESVHPVTYPGANPTVVREFAAVDRTEEFCDAVDALDAALGLSRPGAARLLVIVSDGQYRSDQRSGGQKRISRLRHAGCGVLWLTLATHARPLEGAHTVALSAHNDAARAIGQAAIRALAATD
jgi:hypothetical protein